MNRKLLGVPLGALLLVGGTTAVLAQSGTGEAMAEAAGGVIGARGLLGEVLDDLVRDGTISRE